MTEPTDEVKREAGELGYILRRIAIFGGRAFNHEKPADIEGVGRDLRRAETKDIYLDGGQSVAALISEIREASTKLTRELSGF